MSWTQRFLNYFKNKHNKILAVLLAALGVITLVGYYLCAEVGSSWTYFRRNPIEIWNFGLSLAVYLIILICNIRNDSFAYHGIAMFVFYVAFSAAIDFLYNSVTNAFYLYFGNAVGIFFDILYGALFAATAVIGILLYIWMWRYMSGRYVPWMRIRIFSIIFASLLVLKVGYYIFACCLSGISLEMFAELSLIPISEMFIGGSIVFTLERLRRV